LFEIWIFKCGAKMGNRGQESLTQHLHFPKVQITGSRVVFGILPFLKNMSRKDAKSAKRRLLFAYSASLRDYLCFGAS
jgi:hypothetical protein